MFTIKSKLFGQVRKAVQEYDMIQDGDIIAVGVSGGKDSMALLIALKKLQSYYDKKFKLKAITITMGIGEFDTSPISELCKELDIEYHVVETQIGKIIFDERKETNPCSLCANMRRGALHGMCQTLGCNKIALAHHKDDVIETLLLSLFYEGRIHTFSPVTYLERRNLHMIRPLIFTEELEIRSFIKKNSIKIIKNPCTANGHTKRQFIKDMIWNLQKETKDIKSNLFGAIRRSGIDQWK